MMAQTNKRRADDLDMTIREKKAFVIRLLDNPPKRFRPWHQMADAQLLVAAIRKRYTLPEQLKFVRTLRSEICQAQGFMKCSYYGLIFGITPVAISEAVTKFLKGSE